MKSPFGTIGKPSTTAFTGQREPGEKNIEMKSEIDGDEFWVRCHIYGQS